MNAPVPDWAADPFAGSDIFDKPARSQGPASGNLFDDDNFSAPEMSTPMGNDPVGMNAGLSDPGLSGLGGIDFGTPNPDAGKTEQTMS